MPPSSRKILVTSALPYANGPIHIGHLVEYVQTDIWVRFQRLAGRDCLFICASDAHGTPIMLKAREQGVAPEATGRALPRRASARFQPFPDRVRQLPHHALRRKPRTRRKDLRPPAASRTWLNGATIRQAYDAQAEMFLPDRFIRGTCPVCGAADQYGDSCEVCGATYSPSDLIDARSVVTGSRSGAERIPSTCSSGSAASRRRCAPGPPAAISTRASPKSLTSGSRPACRTGTSPATRPISGFAIPGTEDKYFYVWLDAPVGYMASFCQAHIASTAKTSK